METLHAHPPRFSHKLGRNYFSPLTFTASSPKSAAPRNSRLSMSLTSSHGNALAQAAVRAAFGRSHGIRCAAAAAEAH